MVLPHPELRTRRAPDPPPAGRPGPRAHVFADAVLLHQLAHETSPGPDPVPRPRQTRRGRQTPDPGAPAQRSDAALAKAARKRTDDNLPVHTFTSLIRRPGHHLRQPIQLPPTPRRSPCTPPPPRYSSAPSTCSASPIATATRSECPTRPN